MQKGVPTESFFKTWLLTVILAIAVTSACISISALANSNRQEFQPASSVAETLSQHKRLPAPSEEVWWTPTGKDMAWNNKNLQQLFPTVPVYRDGPVRELSYDLNPAIDNFNVDTPDGSVRFIDFLDGDGSTSMGVVILHKGKIVFEHYPRMREYEKPIWWSVTKVFAASLIAVMRKPSAKIR